LNKDLKAQGKESLRTKSSGKREFKDKKLREKRV